MTDWAVAVLFAFLLSILIVAIEITKESTSSGKALLSGPVFLYLAIIIVGNTFSTFLAATFVPSELAEAAPAWFIYAFMGVFGFEVVVQKVNLTFSDNDVLTINKWISTAKDSAIAHIVEMNVRHKELLAVQVATRLQQLDAATLNAHVLNHLGNDRLLELDQIAAGSQADPGLIKALALAKENYAGALAISPD